MDYSPNYIRLINRRKLIFISIWFHLHYGMVHRAHMELLDCLDRYILQHHLPEHSYIHFVMQNNPLIDMDCHYNLFRKQKSPTNFYVQNYLLLFAVAYKNNDIIKISTNIFVDILIMKILFQTTFIYIYMYRLCWRRF